MAHQLSVGRILKRDWPSLCFSVFISAFWLIAIACYLLVMVWYPEDKEGWLLAYFMGGGAFLVTALCGAVLVWRLRIIRRVFACGEVVRGQVLIVGENSEDVGYAVISYLYKGREYRVSNVTEGAVGRGRLAPDDLVDIVVDPSKPSRAFIVKLYIQEVEQG
jgi:hypothetical protein